MTLTHHPVRLFRLSCGCLRAYPMMPAGTEHTVLCVRCRAEAVTVLAYPERICGIPGWALSVHASQSAGRMVMVACTLPRRTCRGGLHRDEVIGVQFTAQGPALAAAREGRA